MTRLTIRNDFGEIEMDTSIRGPRGITGGVWVTTDDGCGDSSSDVYLTQNEIGSLIRFLLDNFTGPTQCG